MLRQHEQPLPYLREYLAELNKASVPGAGLFLFAGAMLLVAVAGILLSPAEYARALFYFVIASIGIVAGAYANSSYKRRNPRLFTEQHKNAVQLGRQMLFTKRLHKTIDGGSAELLEESARYWREITTTLYSSNWKNSQLPEHWRAVRNRVTAATNDAMEEMLLLLQSSFRPNSGPQGLPAKVEEVVETFVTGPRFRKGDLLPPEFETARLLAEKLKLLANEVRQATAEISRQTQEFPQDNVATALDMAISDIRSIQQAEQELRIEH